MKQHTTLYIVRHGETDWNAQGRLQGQQGAELNDIGKEQAKALAKELAHIPFDAIYSSDLSRAQQTAEIIAHQRDLDVITSELLRERRFGPFEGKSYDTLKDFDLMLETLSDHERFAYKGHPDMESDEDVMNRLLLFFKELARVNKGKHVLIVTHGGVMRPFLIHSGHETYASLSYKTSKVSNGSYIEAHTDGQTFQVMRTVGIEKKQA